MDTSFPILSLTLTLAFTCAQAHAQSYVFDDDFSAPVSRHSNQYEFEFARLVYDGGYEWPRWRADWPEAEEHFNQGLTRLTSTNVSPSGVTVTLTDEELFDYPWLYVVEVGHMSLSDREVEQLREYLARGGFLVVDDFHGEFEWQHFLSVLRRINPSVQLHKLDKDSDVFNIHFDIQELTQIPGIRSVYNNRTWEKGGINAAWYAIYDEEGQLSVLVNFNQDLGDAWEHADDADYPQPFTGTAYRMGVNYVIYSMTH